jgi:hypothetical protein
LVSLPPTAPALQANNEPSLGGKFIKLSTNPTWINCLYFQRFYDNDDTSPFRSSKQNLLQTIPQFLLSSRIGRGTYPPQPRHRTVFHLSTIHTTFRLLLRHQNRSRIPSF